MKSLVCDITMFALYANVILKFIKNRYYELFNYEENFFLNVPGIKFIYF